MFNAALFAIFNWRLNVNGCLIVINCHHIIYYILLKVVVRCKSTSCLIVAVDEQVGNKMFKTLRYLVTRMTAYYMYDINSYINEGNISNLIKNFQTSIYKCCNIKIHHIDR